MVIENGELKEVTNEDIVNGTVVIPEGVTSIKKFIFYRCSGLASIKIPSSVTSIEKSVFYGCSSLTSIEVDENNRMYMSSNGILYNKNQEKIIKCPSKSNLTSIRIPEGVTSIGEFAFAECSNLTSIHIPNSVASIGTCAFRRCSSLTSIHMPDSVTNIGFEAFDECSNLKEVMISKEYLDKNIESLAWHPNLLEIIFKKNYERIQQVKEKANFHCSRDFTEEYMNILYYRMIHAIGIEEIEKMVEIPNLTAEEIRQYSLEKDEAFHVLYDTKYQLSGDFGLTLEMLKELAIQLPKKASEGKNTLEMRLFKSINQKLEEGYTGNFVSLMETCLKEQEMEVEPDWISKIAEFEQSKKKANMLKTLEKMEGKIGEALGEGAEENREAIVPMQIKPIEAMIEDVIKVEYREKGTIELEKLRQALEEKIENAHAPYIVQHKEQIVKQAMKVLERDENFQEGMKFSLVNAMRNTKESIGGTWKYQLNQTLQQMGYSFASLPGSFTKEEREKFSDLLKGQEIKSEPISVLKEGADREEAYKLLAKKELPKLVTYQQLHDMFFTVHGPYLEEFKEYFKTHRKEFLENPEYYGQFGRIHNNFKEIIEDPNLKNIYEKGELSVDKIIGYLKGKTFANQKPGDEKLAKLASGVGNISKEEEFAKVKEVFEITKQRERTSIPPVKITESKYRGRMLSPDDVMQLFVGDITTCCQRFTDVGEGSMLLGSIEENGGIFVVEELDEKGKVKNIVGQSLVIRQKGERGNYDRLTFDNIEITNGIKKTLTKQEEDEILEIYQEAGKEAMKKDQKFLQRLVKDGHITQEEYDSLVLKEVVAGTGYNDLEELENLPEAKAVVPDEARNQYQFATGKMGYPWIDSAGGKAPQGSKGRPAVLATMEERELEEIEQRRNQSKLKETIKPKEVPLWYGKVGEVETLVNEEITGKIETIKKIERGAFRKEQQLLNKCNAKTPEEMQNQLVDMDRVEKATIKLGSNEDWYVYYTENQEAVEIACLAAVTGIRAEKNEEFPKANAKLATVESANELYGILLEAKEEGKQIHCDATADTSLINLKNMLQREMIELKDQEGRNIIWQEKELRYEDTGEPVETREWSIDSDISMLRLEIIPDPEKIKEEKEKIEKLLEKVSESIRMQGSKKEKGLEELRNKVRKEWKETDDAR